MLTLNSQQLVINESTLTFDWLECVAGTPSHHDAENEGDANNQFNFYVNYQYRVSEKISVSRILGVSGLKGYLFNKFILSTKELSVHVC